MDSPEQIIDQVRFGHRPDDGFAIRAKGLCKTYGDGRKQPAKQALKSVDIDIPIGQIYGLLGPNGAGKSTFINIMAGTVVKTAGSISIWGTDIDANPRQARANIGIVPQELNIDAYFTPRQTLEMTAGLFGVPKDQRRSDEFLEMVGLTDQAHTYARRLSGGMRRRLLVAKAMVHSPPILVLDEPTAGVDVALRQKLWDNILMLNAHGVTIVLTTHYLHEAETLCDHIAILDEGRIITSQPKKTLIAGASRKEMRMTLAPSVATSAPSTAAPTPGATSTQNTRPTALPETLQALGVQWQDDYLVARYDPQKINAATIIASVTKAGFSIEEISTVEPDLEDVFLDLTGK